MKVRVPNGVLLHAYQPEHRHEALVIIGRFGRGLIALNLIRGFLLPDPIVLDRLRCKAAAVHIPAVANMLYLLAVDGGAVVAAQA